MTESYKNRNFLISEVLGCITIILTSINVILAREMHSSGAPVWMPSFGFLYWSKTILAIVGLCYFFTSKVFIDDENPKYISVITLILLLYSLPIINMFFTMPFEILFSGISTARKQGITYESRIPTLIVWAIPAFIVMLDVFKKLFRIKK